MADSGQWRRLEAVVRAQFPTAIFTSAYRPGSKADGSNHLDYHSSGDAIDIGGGVPLMTVFNWLVTAYPGSAEVIHTPGGKRQLKDGQPHVYSGVTAAGHFNHVHWAAPDLVKAKTGGTGAVNASFGGTTEAIAGIGSFIDFFSNGGMWARLAVTVVGALLLLMGVAILTGKQIVGMLPIGRVLDAVRGGS